MLKKYLITDPKYYNYKNFEKNLIKVFNKQKIDFALFRDKSLSKKQYKKLAKKFCLISKRYNIKAVLHRNKNLASKLNCYGVHFTSLEIDKKIPLAKKLNLKVFVSTHNQNEIKKSIKLEANLITYSPIFGFEKGEPKGLNNLKKIITNYSAKIKIFALGGIISNKEIKLIKKIKKLYGFGAIRTFL